jgi:hypothetical protein
MLRNPGGLSSGIEEAIKPRLGAEMRSIGQNYGNLRSEQAGASARGNLPMSIKGALQKALNTNQARAEQGARGQAIMKRPDSGWRCRADNQLLDQILGFLSSGEACHGRSQAANQISSQLKRTALETWPDR